jgi:RND superfamily putative drug exporter
MLVVAGVLSSGLGTALDNSADFTNQPESKKADNLIESHIGKSPMTETVVIQSSDLTVDDPQFKQVVEKTTNDLRGMTNAVASAASYYDAAAAGDPTADSMVSKDRHTTVIPVTLKGTDDDVADYSASYVSLIESERTSGVDVYSVGAASGSEAYGKIAAEDAKQAETIGLPVALLVLVVVFGALLAAGIPLLLGVVSIFVAMGLTAVVGQVLSISDTVMMMITMIGLAVGIDYALFVIERFREERRHGVEKIEAIAIAGGTAGKAVFFSGMTVILALMGMFILPITVFHSLAAGAILAVLVAIVATQTLVPALLRLMGDWINFPRRKRFAPMSAEAMNRYDHETIHKGFWGRVTSMVMRRPVVTLLAAVGLLVALALPAMDLKTGTAGVESLPDSDVKTGYMILQEKFYAGMIAPVRIVIDGPTNDPQVTEGVANLKTALAQDSMYGPATVTTSPDGALTIVEAPMSVDSESQAAYDGISHLRADTIPAAFGGFEKNVYVTGDSAGTLDFNNIMDTYTPYVFAFVLGLSFLLLMLAFRSIVVPAKAIIMNLLSVGAAYGALVLVFQKGVGADLLGMQQVDTIAAWIPVFLFCVLFGLSMDYHVFLLSRVREHYDATHRNDESVAVGLQSTAKIITGAALIMVVVFGAFAAGRLSEMQQMGFGLAVAVFLDATVVRSILVPSGMKLLGDRNWYLPRWLSWLPDLRIEGEPVQHTAPVMQGTLEPAGDD